MIFCRKKGGPEGGKDGGPEGGPDGVQEGSRWGIQKWVSMFHTDPPFIRRIRSSQECEQLNFFINDSYY